MVLRFFCSLCVFAVNAIVAPAALTAETVSASKLYAEHCASCHGAERLGAMGPALLPENLGRLRRAEAVTTIKHGRPATQMPAFGSKLSDTEIESLVGLISQAPERQPVWGLNEIAASRISYIKEGEALSDKPVFAADPLNLFVVVELGDHHVSLLDGDSFDVIKRFPTRFALHGGPKYSSNGRYVYFASRDGWISKYDIWNLRYVAEIRAGINTRNLAVSDDDRYVMVANYLPHTLVALDAKDLRPLKVIEAKDDNGKTSRVSAVYDAAPRKSFVAALKDIPELWEIPYGDDAAPVYHGLVHDYRSGEGIAAAGPFPVRRVRLDDYLDDFFFDPSYAYVIGASRDGGKGQVVNLDVRRRIATLDLPGLPHLGSGIAWNYRGTEVMATPNLKNGVISVIDMKSWKIIKHIDTLGPGFFLRSHENTPFAWADNMMSKQRDTIEIIDKRTLEVARRLRPAPGKTAAHVEFTRDGKYALVSVWDMDGAVVVYDASTFKEVKRLPMKKPSGKYNVYNKITRSAGTSH
jgi:DNA-binding beta-propeller fold protein YncE/cytochrome c5